MWIIINKKLSEIKEFAKSTNSYQKNSYQSQKSKVEITISEAESLNKEQTNDGIAPWKIMVPVTLTRIFILGALIIYRRRKATKNKDGIYYAC